MDLILTQLQILQTNQPSKVLAKKSSCIHRVRIADWYDENYHSPDSDW